MTTAAAPLQSKTHYQSLDGLRGVAALTVVAFHLFEPWSRGDHTRQIINHGYLAVDFFFLLSGFVIAYAYDDRWSRMSLGSFFKRRLIRLHPMILMGMAIGAVMFYFQAGPPFPFITHTPVWKMLLVFLIGCTLIPTPPSLDIRGWGEMHTLDGPAWTLFFEYIANILYALGIRKLPKAALAVLVLASAIFLAQLAIFSPHGDVIGGWAFTPHELHVGFARLLYPFFAGMLLERLGKRIHVPNAFTVCSILLLIALFMPRIGGHAHVWMNGIYDSFAIIIIFPLIVAIGAGDRPSTPRHHKITKTLGDISYPLYITHYPWIYLYTSWLLRDHVSRTRGAVVGAMLYITVIAIAYACLKLYDEPLRAWLNRRFDARIA